MDIKELEKKIQEILKKNIGDTPELDLSDYENDTKDGILLGVDDKVVEFISEQGVTYHDQAMEYLMDNDTDLSDTRELLKEQFGNNIPVDFLYPENLASMLLQKIMLDEYYEIQDEINDAINEYVKSRDNQ